jgi:hypothetical protein
VSTEVELAFRAPARPGRYVLRIALVQEHVAWFDDLDPGAGWAGEIEVALPQAPVSVPAGPA